MIDHTSLVSNEAKWFGVGGIVFLLLFLFVRPVRWLIRKISMSPSSRFSHAYPARKEAEQNKEIYNELVGLRATIESDRSYVFRFHNGVEFLPSHPAWKVSCTHEVVRHGVTYEAAQLQGILVSRISDIIGPVLTGASTIAGVFIPKCPVCPYHVKCLKENKRVIVFQVDEMDAGYCKFHLESQNIKTMVLCGMAVDSNVYGIVGVDFCGSKIETGAILDIAQKVCRATEKIQYYLQYGKASEPDVELPIPDKPITSANGR